MHTSATSLIDSARRNPMTLRAALAVAIALAIGASPVRATTHSVTSCADDGSAGTLRDVIAHASDGDTADLSPLSCSTITLATGEIVIPQNNLVLYSPAEHPVTIDAHRVSRVIEHDGSGVLGLVRVNLANGYFKYNSVNAIGKGGCLLSNGSIGMTTATVSGCQAVNIDGQVEGGAVYAIGQVNAAAGSVVSGSSASGVQALGGGICSGGETYLMDSSVSGNRAFSNSSAANALAIGGGVFASRAVARVVRSRVSDNVAESPHGTALGGGINASAGAYLSFSVISGNTALAPGSGGGAMRANGNSYLYYSTIDHNQAVNNAAVMLGGTSANTARIGNSTISTNTATTGSSAVFASIPLLVNNSTIAFNLAAGSSAGLYLYGSTTATIESSILSNNTSSARGGFDLVAAAAVGGSHNLVRSAAATLPGDTLTAIDPQLEPLASNFSFNAPLTHALAPGSPAIDRGWNPRSFNFDERGEFNARVVGLTADIGAYEWNGVDTDTIFANGFD